MSTVSNDVEKGRGAHHEYGSTAAAPAPGQFRKIANPGPLGLSAFALTTFVLSLVRIVLKAPPDPILTSVLFIQVNVQARDVTVVSLFRFPLVTQFPPL